MHYIDSSVIGNNPPARRKSPYEEYHIKRVIFTYEDLQANLISVGDMYRSMAGQSKSARVGMFRRLESIAREFAEMASQKAGLLPTGERILPYSLDKMVERHRVAGATVKLNISQVFDMAGLKDYLQTRVSPS